MNTKEKEDTKEKRNHGNKKVLLLVILHRIS